MPRIIATDSCHRQQLKRASDAINVQPMVANTKDDFAARLNQACDRADPPIPQGRGRRAELRRKVMQQGLEVSGESVRKWLSGESIPSMDNLRFIACALDVETEWLLTGRERKGPDSTSESSVHHLRQPESPSYFELSQPIRDVIAIMLEVDHLTQDKVLFAAQLAKHEYEQAQHQNSIKRAGQ